jgi:hypothetical protein
MPWLPSCLSISCQSMAMYSRGMLCSLRSALATCARVPKQASSESHTGHGSRHACPTCRPMRQVPLMGPFAKGSLQAVVALHSFLNPALFCPLLPHAPSFPSPNTMSLFLPALRPSPTMALLQCPPPTYLPFSATPQPLLGPYPNLSTLQGPPRPSTSALTSFLFLKPLLASINSQSQRRTPAWPLTCPCQACPS